MPHIQRHLKSELRLHLQFVFYPYTRTQRSRIQIFTSLLFNFINSLIINSVKFIFSKKSLNAAKQFSLYGKVSKLIWYNNFSEVIIHNAPGPPRPDERHFSTYKTLSQNSFVGHWRLFIYRFNQNIFLIFSNMTVIIQNILKVICKIS